MGQALRTIYNDLEPERYALNRFPIGIEPPIDDRKLSHVIFDQRQGFCDEECILFAIRLGRELERQGL